MQDGAVARPETSGASPSTRGLWALGFVALCLVALVAVPTYYGQRVAVVQSRISDVLEPAARLSSNLGLLKARQMARVEGFLLTGDRAFREPYIAAIAEEDSVVAGLRVLARDLNIEVFERVARFTSSSTDWNFSNQRIFDAPPDVGARAQVQAGYDGLQRAIRELDRAIQSEVLEGRRAMANERRRQARITTALAFLALLATLMVGRVASRYRALLIEREMRRRDAVRARREIDSLLEATGDGVLGIDLDGACISLNRAGSHLLGYKPGEIMGREVHDTLFHTLAGGVPHARADSPILAAIPEGRLVDSEGGAIIWRRKRTSFPARWSLRPMMDGTELRGAVLTFTDMTEIHEKEAALRRAIQQREDVVSIVSHDLRNPLGVVLAAADLLLDLPLDDNQRRRQAEIIARSGRRMLHLIEDLLDLARMEAGALVVRPSQEDLLPILEEARSVFADQAEARSVLLEVSPAGGQPLARVDRDRIMQALSNLLDNAIRLTPSGGTVTLAAREDRDHVYVSVVDTGPGIAPDRLERLFDRFTQINGGGGGAAGLGLAIVRGVATAHDGEVTVQSEVGRGSTFSLRLPKRGPLVGEDPRSEGLAR
ncbi:MAG: ATP-binding protein [Gemmatimonadetes bacterium]|nr:ATP-binding protein [Gemmatimonadota bacterium]MDA1102799.1 ATP-binding protein [Gemmatimonadota bacterium]